MKLSAPEWVIHRHGQRLTACERHLFVVETEDRLRPIFAYRGRLRLKELTESGLSPDVSAVQSRPIALKTNSLILDSQEKWCDEPRFT